MSLSRDDILNYEDLSYKYVHIPEWNGDVRIKTMSISEQIEYEELAGKKKKESDLALNLIYLCCVDDNGERLFKSEEDIEAIKKKSGPAISKLFQECLLINSISQQEVESLSKKS